MIRSLRAAWRSFWKARSPRAAGLSAARPPRLPPALVEPPQLAQLRAISRRVGVLEECPQKVPPEAQALLAELLALDCIEPALSVAVALVRAVPRDHLFALQVAGQLALHGQPVPALRLLEQLLAQPSLLHAQRVQALALAWHLDPLQHTGGQPQRFLADLLLLDWNHPGAQVAWTAPRIGVFAPEHGAPFLPAVVSPPASLAVAFAPTLAPGCLPAGFQLLRELGRGATGTVYLAQDPALAHTVALKLFHRPLTDLPATPPADGPLSEDGSPEDPFHPLRRLANLQHPGLVSLYSLDWQGRYLVMEVLAAGSLRPLLTHPSGLPIHQHLLRAAHRTVEILAALAAAHQVGLVHGDLKPENLLFRAPACSLHCLPFDPTRGDLVLIDFPLSSRASATAPALSLSYAAPERLAGQSLAPPADLFSAGLLIAQLFATQPLPPRSDLLAPIAPLWQSAPAHLTGTAFDWLHQQLNPLLRGLLLPDPSQRFTAAQAQLLAQSLLARLVPPGSPS